MAHQEPDEVKLAPGWPGISPKWTSSAKTGLGTALNSTSRIWFTMSHGILNEVYYPNVDQACTRDFGLIVTDGRSFFSEEKRHTRSEVATLADDVPAYRLTNTCVRGRYRIEKEVVSDPKRPVVLQRVRFVSLQGPLAGHRLFCLLAPHIGNRGAGNTAWTGELGGRPMLFARRQDCALAVACSAPFIKRSVGFVGVSDGWQDLSENKRLTWLYDRAENGNVALTAEMDLAEDGSELVLALGFGDNPTEAADRALQSLNDGFDQACKQYIQEWQAWLSSLRPMNSRATSARHLDLTSAAVMRTCESKAHSGGIVASLSVPWGFNKGDDDLGGYHLIWPRDLVETAGGLLAVGANEDVRRILAYLQSTQCDDGHWAQNMWIDGTAYWDGVQLDETAFPILLVDLTWREGLTSSEELKDLWPMLRLAARYLVANGPVTLQDRWEEDPGYSPFTLAVTIASLLCAADFADFNDEPSVAVYLRECADFWNDSIERWTYVSNTALAREVGVEGYYVRIAPPDTADAASPAEGFVPIKNRPPGQSQQPADSLLSPDALAYVRFGLRAPDDPKIIDTVKVIDARLKVDLPGGPSWYRYNDDGYGEHADGSAFDGTGVGRAWPLLTGERAHYELAAGRHDEAERLLRAMENFAGDGGLISEQVWDKPDIPERELFLGRPSGSAMPLVWAHAEYVKLRRSLESGQVFDLPGQTYERYVAHRNPPRFHVWRFNQKCRVIPPGRVLRVETHAASVVHWSSDGWQTSADAPTRDTGIGIHVAELPVSELRNRSEIVFTFFWPEVDRWEGADFTVEIRSV